MYFQKVTWPPRHPTKIQNSLCSVSCLIINIYNKINWVLCTFHPYVWCLSTGKSIGKSTGLIVWPDSHQTATEKLYEISTQNSLNFPVVVQQTSTGLWPDNVGDCNDLHRRKELYGFSETQGNTGLAGSNYCERSTILLRIWKLLGSSSTSFQNLLHHSMDYWRRTRYLIGHQNVKSLLILWNNNPLQNQYLWCLINQYLSRLKQTPLNMHLGQSLHKWIPMAIVIQWHISQKPSMTLKGTMRFMTENCLESFMLLKNGDTIFKDPDTPLLFIQTTRTWPISSQLKNWTGDRPDGHYIYWNLIGN